jgi:hypothetical protein
MGSLGMRLHWDCNEMRYAAKISPRILSPCALNAILSLLILRDCKAMGDSANLSPCVPSTQRLAVLFSHVQISRQDPSDPSFLILWPARGLTSTQCKLHPCLGV